MFNSRLNYKIALLRLLDTLPNHSGRSMEIQKLFLEKHREEIPQEDFEELPSGGYRWAKEVQWSRYECVQNGLMDSPSTGIWRLTEQGRQWLQDHPNATLLSEIRIKPQQIATQPPAIKTKQSIQSPRIIRREFFVALERLLGTSLRPILGSISYKFIQRSNYLQVRLDGFGGCHYEVILRREELGKHEIALHFESSKNASEARLQEFEAHIEELSQSLGVRVQAGAFGNSGWTQVAIERTAKPLSQELAQELSDQAIRFIDVTYPILKKVYSSHRRSHRSLVNKELSTIAASTHMILDREVEAIRVYLQGRSALQPEDEKLCDWINFCYIFELYVEGIEIFSLVNSEAVHPWYYERTKKIARLCALRAKNQY